jgi:hypothetical protein
MRRTIRPPSRRSRCSPPVPASPRPHPPSSARTPTPVRVRVVHHPAPTCGRTLPPACAPCPRVCAAARELLAHVAQYGRLAARKRERLGQVRAVSDVEVLRCRVDELVEVVSFGAIRSVRGRTESGGRASGRGRSETWQVLASHNVLLQQFVKSRVDLALQLRAVVTSGLAVPSAARPPPLRLASSRHRVSSRSHARLDSPLGTRMCKLLRASTGTGRSKSQTAVHSVRNCGAKSVHASSLRCARRSADDVRIRAYCAGAGAGHKDSQQRALPDVAAALAARLQPRADARQAVRPAPSTWCKPRGDRSDGSPKLPGFRGSGCRAFEARAAGLSRLGLPGFRGSGCRAFEARAAGSVSSRALSEGISVGLVVVRISHWGDQFSKDLAPGLTTCLPSLNPGSPAS